MDKIDYKKEYKHLYKPSAKKVSEVEVPAFNYLMIDGEGDPNSEDFMNAIEALYGTAYTLKFMFKKRDEEPVDYTVMPMEGMWWADDMDDFVKMNKDNWKWTLMIMKPDFITKKHFNEAVKQATAKKEIKAIGDLRLEKLKKHKAVTIMHIGPYAEEAPTIEKMHKHIEENGYEFTGLHHEIYLSDPRRAAPEKLKTVLRQPYKK